MNRRIITIAAVFASLTIGAFAMASPASKPAAQVIEPQPSNLPAASVSTAPTAAPTPSAAPIATPTPTSQPAPSTPSPTPDSHPGYNPDGSVYIDDNAGKGLPPTIVTPRPLARDNGKQ